MEKYRSFPFLSSSDPTGRLRSQPLKPGGSEFHPVMWMPFYVDFFQRAGSTSKVASLICMDNGPRNYVPSNNPGACWATLSF